MTNNISEGDNIDWDSILPILTAFALYLLNQKFWLKGGDSDSFMRGKQARDYVLEGVSRYLEHPEKYDPTKSSLVDYLKWNIIRSLISNDSRAAENKTTVGYTSDVYENDSTILESIDVSINGYFDDQIDYDNIISAIQNETKGDTTVENIFLGITQRLKRSEIIDEFKIKPKDYDLGKKRLDTIIRRIMNEFQIKHSDYGQKTKR